jgi:hypothetical protein
MLGRIGQSINQSKVVLPTDSAINAGEETGWSVFKVYHTVSNANPQQLQLASITKPLSPPTTLAKAVAYAEGLVVQDQFITTSPSAPCVTYHVKPHDTVIPRSYQS